jgi:protein-S-isoprenylcysteine O-methyltransferase
MKLVVPAYAAEPGWQAAFWISYLAWVAMEMWIFSRDRRAASGEAQDQGSRRFLVMLFMVGLFGAFFIAHHLAWGRIALPLPVLMGAALALMWSGMAFRVWAVVTLGRFFRTSVFVLDDHRLIETGPYARLRNPSYTGGVATLFGIGLGLGNWLALGWLMAFMLIGYARRIRVEEAALRARFGPAYEAYARRRWVLIPPIW